MTACGAIFVLHISIIVFIYLFGVLRCFQHCTGHITTGSWKGRGNQYIEFARGLYCKLPTNGRQLPAFPHKALTGIEPQPQRWEARVLPLCHRGPFHHCNIVMWYICMEYLGLCNASLARVFFASATFRTCFYFCCCGSFCHLQSICGCYLHAFQSHQ